MATKRFSVVIAAGSWDHFHAGHELFLKRALKLSQIVWVGVTAVNLTRNKGFADTIEPYIRRRRSVEHFIKVLGETHRTRFFQLRDIYGPAIKPSQAEAILITEQTLEGGKLVNKRRRALGLAPLQLIKVPYFVADDGKPLFSERIRKGEVNRHGMVYRHIFLGHTLFQLPVALRPRLQQPFGTLVNGADSGRQLKKLIGKKKPSMLVSVGDVVAELFLRHGIRADLSIIDLFVMRKKMFASPEALGFSLHIVIAKVRNKRGEVSGALASVVQHATHKALEGKRQVVLVEGEEDLAVLPAVLEAPLGAYVVYGQPNEGAVIINVTEERKQAAYDLLNKFEKKS